MLNFTGGPYRHCDGVTRRSFLSAGSLVVGGLTLPGLLRAASPSARSRAVIMVYMPGGPPHQDMYDPKPDAPAEVRGEFKPIPTAVPGVHLSELMPMLAARMGRFALIRSVADSDGAHGLDPVPDGVALPQPAGGRAPALRGRGGHPARRPGWGAGHS